MQMEQHKQAGVFVMWRCWCEEGDARLGTKTEPNAETLLMLSLLLCFFRQRIHNAPGHCFTSESLKLSK